MLRRRRIRNLLVHLAQWLLAPAFPVITDEQIRDILRSEDP